MMVSDYIGGVSHLFLKPGAEVIIYPDRVEKIMTRKEIVAYELMNCLSDKLRDDEIIIKIPKLLEHNVMTSRSTLTKIGVFRQFSPVEYFGMSDVYTKDYLQIMLKVFTLIRRHVPVIDVKETTDYEKRGKDGIISSLKYLESGYHADLPDYLTKLRRDIERCVNESQQHIENMKQFAAHRDPNPNNYSVSRGEANEVLIVDWETFGLARIGYDEGRLMTYLALDVKKQDDYLGLVESRLTFEEMIYFWRVVLMRSYREMTSIYGGHYDTRFGRKNIQEHKLKVLNALYTMALRSRDSLDSYLFL